MAGLDDEPQRAWALQWLSAVATGEATMSQRRLSSIERHGGGLDAVANVARGLGVHLVQLTDDRGHTLVAASRHAFKVVV